MLDYTYGNFHAVIVGKDFSDEIEAEDLTLMDINIGETRYLCWYPKNEKREHWLRTVQIIWDQYNADGSWCMDEAESRKFFDSMAKRWKMLGLEPGDTGFKKMMLEITNTNSVNDKIALWELKDFILDKAKDEWMTDKQKFVIDKRQGGQKQVNWRADMCDLWRQANVDYDDYLELYEARKFFDLARKHFPNLDLPDSEEGFQQFMQEADDNASGVISKREFEIWFMQKGKELNFEKKKAKR